MDVTGRATVGSRITSESTKLALALLITGLLLPAAAIAAAEQGQLRIRLVLPEPAAVVAPALEPSAGGAVQLCNRHPQAELREIQFHHDSEFSSNTLPTCTDPQQAPPAPGWHQVVVAPI